MMERSTCIPRWGGLRARSPRRSPSGAVDECSSVLAGGAMAMTSTSCSSFSRYLVTPVRSGTGDGELAKELDPLTLSHPTCHYYDPLGVVRHNSTSVLFCSVGSPSRGSRRRHAPVHRQVAPSASHPSVDSTAAAAAAFGCRRRGRRATRRFSARVQGRSPRSASVSSGEMMGSRGTDAPQRD